jgi:hypothetical protein
MTTWTTRDYQVLKWLQESSPQHGILSTNWQSTDEHPVLPGLTQQDVHMSVEILEDAGLVSSADQTWDSGGGVSWMQFQVTGTGLQALGEWPVFDMLENPKALGQLLDSLAEMSESDQEEENLRSAATRIRSMGRDALQALASGALTAAIRTQI